MVKDVSDTQITATYAVGPIGDFGGGHWKLTGIVDGPTARLTDATQRLDITLTTDERLGVRYNGDRGFAILNRGDLDGDHVWSTASVETLPTDLIEDGAAVALEVVLYKPQGDGPFPLAVINHGSTGRGDDPAIFKDTFQNAWLADMLVERGWMVAFPQRRGRGGSDGLCDEGFAEDRARYTCDGERSLAGADRALDDISAAIGALRQRPDVEISPVLIGGISRGGVLSVTWAGRNPDDTHGVLNFVGGSLGEGCGDSAPVDRRLFSEGGGFAGEMLWLCGLDDTFYSIDFSRQNHAAFPAAGGTGAFHEFRVNGENNGHWVMSSPTLWDDVVISYLDKLRQLSQQAAASIHIRDQHKSRSQRSPNPEAGSAYRQGSPPPETPQEQA